MQAPGIGSDLLAFQQENVSTNVSQQTKAWIATKKFTILEWPALGSDGNPFQNFWSILASKVYQNSHQFYNVTDRKGCI